MEGLETLKEKVLPLLLPMGVRRVSVFGSYARGDGTAESDIDLLVQLKPIHERSPIGLKWYALEAQLAEILGCSVELVEESSLSPYIRPYVLKESILLYEEG